MKDEDKLVEEYIEKASLLNLSILLTLAKRIKELKGIKQSDLYKSDFLLNVGKDKYKINQSINQFNQSQKQSVNNILLTTAKNSFNRVKSRFKDKSSVFIPFSKNKALKKEINTVINNTNKQIQKEFKTQAYMLRDEINPKILVPTPASEAYQDIINKAIQASKGGGNIDSTIRKLVEQFIDSGLREVEYNAESGKFHTQRVDAAVKRNIQDGIRDINQTVQDTVGEQIGADAKEITVHEYPAPDHAPVQGHIFSNEEYAKLQSGQASKDVNGVLFAGFPRAIGTLNCRHFTFSVFTDTKPTYTQEQLDEILARNEAGYTLPNGKHLTMYQCTQRQRMYERLIKAQRERLRYARESGDVELLEKSKAKFSQLSKEYALFSEACNLKPNWKNTSI